MKQADNKEWPTAEVIDRYLRGTASPEEVYSVEKTALEHPFFADAVRGYVDTGERPNIKDWSPDPTFEERFTKRILGMLKNGGIVFLIIASIYLFFNTRSTESIYLVDKTQTDNKEDLLEPLEFEPERSTVVTEEDVKDSTMSFDVPAKTQINKQADAFVRTITAPEPLKPQASVLLDSTSDENKTLTIPSNGGNIYHIENYKVVDYRGKRSVSTQRPVLLTGTPANEGLGAATETTALRTEEVRVPYVSYLEEAMYLFAKQSYVKAWNRFEIILQHFPNDANALFYGGLCNFYLGDHDIALGLFVRSSKNSITTFHEESRWYSAQTMWKLDQRVEACEMMNGIAQDNGFYSTMASEWLTGHSCD